MIKKEKKSNFEKLQSQSVKIKEKLIQTAAYIWKKIEKIPKIIKKAQVRKIIKRLFVIAFSVASAILLMIVSINLYMFLYTKDFIYTSVEDLPEKYTVIIPGARVYKNNVSFVVRDRIEAGADCIKKGKCQKVLISGDHGRKDYDEVNQMRKYMQRIYGLDGKIIFLDHAGFSTYETMYRARDIFLVDQAAIVTQKFHTVRSVYIARKLGIDAVAYTAPELNPFSNRIHASWTMREILARVKSFFLVLFKIPPTYLGEQIPIQGEASKSWDQAE